MRVDQTLLTAAILNLAINARNAHILGCFRFSGNATDADAEYKQMLPYINERATFAAPLDDGVRPEVEAAKGDRRR